MSVLSDLGLPQASLLLALAGFNIGVELDQMAIVAAFLSLVLLLRVISSQGAGVPRRIDADRIDCRRLAGAKGNWLEADFDVTKGESYECAEGKELRVNP